MHRKTRHGSQISISDENHHVTEAIGNIYGDGAYSLRDSRVLSTGPVVADDASLPPNANASFVSSIPRPQASRTYSGGIVTRTAGQANGVVKRSGSSETSSELERPLSPGLAYSDRAPVESANAPFPLSDVNYESDPAAVAQEMVNLQALRRMSMVDNATNDPDLPSYNTSHMPTVAPTGSDDEDDTSRLFWVPASLHPELAPKEFKTFLEKRIGEIKRTAGDGSLSPNALQRHGSGGGLRRKKSMLSRQIDNRGGRGAEGYEDGAELLERKRSQSGQVKSSLKVADLQELDELAQDPSSLMRKLSLETERMASDSPGEVPASEDMPILPTVPSGHALRRSTRTTYRRGSQRKGERLPFPKRLVKTAEPDSDDSAASSPVAHSDDVPVPGISRVQTEPLPRAEPVANFSLPTRLDRASISTVGHSRAVDDASRRSDADTSSRPRRGSASFAQRVAGEAIIPASKRPSSPNTPENVSVPTIVETPPPSEPSTPRSEGVVPLHARIPERKSSHEPPPSFAAQGTPPSPGIAAPRVTPGSSGLVRHAQNAKPTGQTLNDIVSQPSPLPGSSTRTDSLSFIPTYTEERKGDKKGKDKKEREGSDSGGAARKSSWGWFLGGDEKEKEKESAKKSKTKGGRASDKPHDNARLDLLQTSIDGSRGRESLVLDRESVKLEEERKKESGRKSTDSKKEKESGLFSTFFGGGKKKERETVGKGGRHSRGLSPDPPHRALRPDIDYHWTRFSLVEERAIYRMAHIKLANPRRPLYCQVLLSNFMYSYLAKVQQMHPAAMHMPQTLLQKQQQRQQQNQQQQQQHHQQAAQQSQMGADMQRRSSLDNQFHSSSSQVASLLPPFSELYNLYNL